MNMRSANRSTLWTAAAISAATCVTAVGSDALSHASRWRAFVNESAAGVSVRFEKPALNVLRNDTIGLSDSVALAGRFE
jgi:hypothetical protein